MTTAQIILFVPAALLVALSPGINNLLAFASATRIGWRRAAMGVPGRMAAWAILVGLVSLGLDAVLSASLVLFLTIKWLGVAYLLYLAVRFWTADTTGAVPQPGGTTQMRREFLTLMGNPKAYLVLTVFLPPFVDTAHAAMPQLLGLGGVYIVAEVVAALVWACGGAILGAHALTPLRRRLVNRLSALLMAGAAFVLARSGRLA